MKVIPKLNLNQNPQNCEEGSLVFAKNMKLDSDGSLTTDFGSEDLQNCTSDDVNFVGHIVGLDNKIYLFSHKYDDNIYEYDEITKKAKRLTTGWNYSGGEIDGCVSTNISGEKILSIAECDPTGAKNIPLKHINLSFCKDTDDESLYTQAPRVPICNLTLNTTYAKTIPNGTYVFFIRYKIRKDCYTNWYLCSCPIFGGTSTKITTLQGGVSYINHHTDAAKSFVFDISFINSNAKNLYQSFQLGFILTHDDSTNARSWKEFNMNTTKIYFDYEGIEEINIDDLLSSTYELYNVRNITNFKNKLYISNYKESNINEDTADISREIVAEFVHSDPNGTGKINYHNLTFNGNKLSYNNNVGYYDKTESGRSLSYLLASYHFNYECSKLYKGETIEKNKIASFDIKWDANDNPDLCTVYNIFNDSYINGAIFGYTEERLFNEGKIGIIQHYSGNGLWLYDRDTSKPHQWDDLGFTFIYGSTSEKDSDSLVEARNGVFLFNKDTKIFDKEGGSDFNYWVTRNKGFSNEARAFIKKNIKDEIEHKSRLIYCYLELSSGAETYPIGFSSYMNKDTYIGFTNFTDYGIENANSSNLHYAIENKIKEVVFDSIKNNIVGIDENGTIILKLGSSYIRASTATVVFKAIKFTIDDDDIIDDENHFNKRFYINAKITEWKSVCNFNLAESVIKIDDTVTDSLIQKPTLMPFSTYDIYAHYIDDYHIITNGTFVNRITTDNAKSNIDTIDLQYIVHSLAGVNVATPYKAFFLSIVNVGNQVMECFNYKKQGTNNIVNCLEIDCLLYNINTNITIKDDNGNTITTQAKYYSSGSSYPTLAFGNCGFISWNDSSNHGNKTLYAVIERNTTTDKNPILTKATPYIPLKDAGRTKVKNGFYNSYFCLVKKPDFDLASSCYVSGKDVYKADRNITLSLSEFTGYMQIQNSVTYFLRSNFNLNYLSLTEDINDQIFSIGNPSSGIKQVAKVINSATLSFIYELKGMYKDFRNKTFKKHDDDITKIDFDNTVRVSNVLSDETFNNSVFKFNSMDYYNVPTDRGIIVKLFAIANNIFVHTKGSLYKFDANQTITANNSDISLTESEPFEHGITQVCDSQYGYAGLDTKQSGCITFDSYVFYDKQSNHIFAYSGNSQLALIDDTIYKLLDYYKPIDCRMIHDEKNTRILINFVLDTNKEITISFNYKRKSFISLHDITLAKAFNSRNICYSYYNGFESLFNEKTINSVNIYGNATKDSYLTDAPDEGTYKDCKFSISVIMFPTEDTQRTSVDSVQYVADLIKQNIIENTAKTKHVMDIARNTRINPVKEFFITTDECQSTSVITNINDESRPNNLLDYKGFKYNLGFWTSNYFRNKLNVNNVYQYPKQPGIEYNPDGSIKKQRIPNSDNYSLVYGKYFILTFGFINDKPIKFENVLVNNSLY